jgi:hypothetical protein
MEFRAIYPTGETEVPLSVLRYRFQWQMSYYLKEPKLLKKGTILGCTAVNDNSANNPHNRSESCCQRRAAELEEMMAGFFDVALEPGEEVRGLFRDAPIPQ